MQLIIDRFSGRWDEFYRPLISGTLKALSRNGELQGLCPLHEDTRPSLTINRETGLWKCFGKCDKGGDAFSFWAKLNNQSTRTDFPRILEDIASQYNIGNGKPKAKHEQKRRIIETYDYRDESGKLLYQTVRYEPKDFRQRRPDGKDDWIWNLKGVRRVPYQLPKLIQAKEVLIVEGEKDCHSLADIGMFSTTFSMGAGKWRPDCAKWFKGKDCFLLPDNDDPGRKHMEQVAASLHGTAARIKILELPGLKEKEDVSDFIHRQPDREAALETLSILAENTEFWVPAQAEGNRYQTENESSSFPFNDVGNGQRLVKHHGADIRYCYLWKKWYVWDGMRWIEDNTGEVWRMARETARHIFTEAGEALDKNLTEIGKHAGKSQSESRLRAMINLAEMDVPILPTDFDRDLYLLNVLNGTFNLKTGELQHHERGDLISRLVPVKYDPGAKCPRWIAFLDRVMAENADLIDFLRRAIGYSLSGDTCEQLFFILLGCGANGKSTFIETVMALLGDYGQQASFETFLTKWNGSGGATNDLAELQGARFVAASEAGASRTLNEPLLKQITGGEAVRARRLYAENIEFYPQLKLFLSANQLPRIKNQDLGIWRRVRLVPFNEIIPPNEQDRQLLAKLKHELPGILNWAIKGCRKWLESGLVVPEEVKVATSQYREEMDTLAAFIDDRCVLSPTSEVLTCDLKKEYENWCNTNSEKLIGRLAFASQLESRGCMPGKSRGKRIWIGIKLKNGRTGH